MPILHCPEGLLFLRTPIYLTHLNSCFWGLFSQDSMFPFHSPNCSSQAWKLEALLKGKKGRKKWDLLIAICDGQTSILEHSAKSLIYKEDGNYRKIWSEGRWTSTWSLKYLQESGPGKEFLCTWKHKCSCLSKEENLSFFTEEVPERHCRSILSLGKELEKTGPQWQHHTLWLW